MINTTSKKRLINDLQFLIIKKETLIEEFKNEIEALKEYINALKKELQDE